MVGSGHGSAAGWGGHHHDPHPQTSGLNPGPSSEPQIRPRSPKFGHPPPSQSGLGIAEPSPIRLGPPETPSVPAERSAAASSPHSTASAAIIAARPPSGRETPPLSQSALSAASRRPIKTR